MPGKIGRLASKVLEVQSLRIKAEKAEEEGAEAAEKEVAEAKRKLPGPGEWHSQSGNKRF